jgi:hypothetical protein
VRSGARGEDRRGEGTPRGAGGAGAAIPAAGGRSARFPERRGGDAAWRWGPRHHAPARAERTPPPPPPGRARARAPPTSAAGGRRRRRWQSRAGLRAGRRRPPSSRAPWRRRPPRPMPPGRRRRRRRGRARPREPGPDRPTVRPLFGVRGVAGRGAEWGALLACRGKSGRPRELESSQGAATSPGPGYSAGTGFRMPLSAGAGKGALGAGANPPGGMRIS